MISEFDIKINDFSVALPLIISKLEIISDGIVEIKGARLSAFGDILEGTIRDLKSINKALYGPS